MISDTDRIEFLQELLDRGRYSNRAILRISEDGRGFRLHETQRPNSHPTVREAIDYFMLNMEEPEYA